MRKLRSEEEIVERWTGDVNLPVVSICCTTYNHELFIEDALEGFLSQETDFPFEVLIHDDASSDGTYELIKKYANKYGRLIRVIRQSENKYSKGGFRPLVYLSSFARGKYIAICEGDDFWVDSSKIQKQVSFLEDNPDYVVVYTDIFPIDENASRLPGDFGGATRDLSCDDLKKAVPIYTLTACYRNVIREIPPEFMAVKYGDLATWTLLGHHGKGKFLGHIKPSVYRVHDGGIHSKVGALVQHENCVITYALFMSYYRRVEEKDLYVFFRKRIFVHALYLCNPGKLMQLSFYLLRGVKKFFSQF